MFRENRDLRREQAHARNVFSPSVLSSCLAAAEWGMVVSHLTLIETSQLRVICTLNRLRGSGQAVPTILQYPQRIGAAEARSQKTGHSSRSKDHAMRLGQLRPIEVPYANRAPNVLQVRTAHMGRPNCEALLSR